MFDSKSPKMWYWLIPLIWLLVFSVPHLDQGDFRTDTGRYAAVGLQMWDKNDLLYSYTQPESPYFRKPPLGFWIHGAVLKVFGVDLAIARAPSIVAAALSLLFTFYFVKRLSNTTWAYASAAILALTYEFVRRTREISLDHWQLAFMLGAAGIMILAIQKQRWRWGIATLAGLLFGLSLLVKPLMGGIGFGIVGLWLIVTQRLTLRNVGLMSWVLLFMLVVGGAWHLYMYAQFGQAFIDGYLGGEVIDRLEGEVNPVGWDYYPLLWLSTYWPWLPFFLLGVVKLGQTFKYLRRSEQDLVWLSAIWLGVWVVVLILLPDKRPRYALVIYPAVAVVSAYGLLSINRLRQWLLPLKTWRIIIPLSLLFILSFAPLRVQAPADPDWRALFTWMDTQGITPRNLWEHNIYDGDAGRFYLRYRQWPHPAIDRLTAKPADVPAGALMLYTDATQPPVGQIVVFRQGKLTVARLPDSY